MLRSLARSAAAACFVLFLTAARAAPPPEPVVVEDFENGTGGWYAVQGPHSPGAAPLVSLTPSAEAQQGQGAGRLRFAPLPGTWAHMQINLSTADWTAAGCDRLRFRLKGDGSGETLNVMLGNYEHKPPLCFVAPVRLDFTGWREITLPFSRFTPEGLSGALRELVLVQLNARETRKPIDVLLDDLCALPDEGAGSGHFYDLDVMTGAGWDSRAPAAPVEVDRIAGIAAKTLLPRTMHGVRNHKDLHNPVVFAVNYPEPGTFAVHIGDTSGYGGSRLLLFVDGREALRRDFPGTTETTLKQYQGWYSIPISAGSHQIRVDNDGADWYTVESYRFGNYGAVGTRVRREDGALEVRFGRPEDARGVSLEASLAGRPLAFASPANGCFVAPPPAAGRFGAGVYPVTVSGSRAGTRLFRRELKMTVRAPRLRALQIAFPVGQPVALAVRWANAADVPTPGHNLRARIGERAAAMADRGDGTYAADLGRLPAGVYQARVSVDGGAPLPIRFLVYDPAGKPWERDGIIRLGPEGRFRTQGGQPFLPWGYATIGVFTPDPETIQGPGGDSAWCRADDRAVRDWIALLRCYGVNCVRFGVNVSSGSIGGDTGGHLDPMIAARLRHFLDILGPLGVRAIPVMWWGHYRNFSFQGIPAYDALIGKQADWFTNEQALALQKQYVREVVEPLKEDPRILAWEVMNETYRAGGDLAAAVRWTNAIVDTIHEVDRAHLTTTSACEATPGPEVQWIRDCKVDFFNWHAYPTYPDYSSWRGEAGADAPREIGAYALTLALSQRLGGRPSILGETGNDRGREVSYPEYRTLITRDCLWIAFLGGSPGGISWDAIADPREFDVLSRLAARVDWSAFLPAPAPVAVRVSDPVKELGSMARYAAWSLRSGVPIRFLKPGESPATGQALAPLPYQAPGIAPTATPLHLSPGYEGMVLSARDGRTLLAYARNAGTVLPQNVRTRSPRDLRLSLRLAAPGHVEVWDLDTREKVWEGDGKRDAVFTAKGTEHDYAVLACLEERTSGAANR